ncbi:unnamed protein product [Bathycoccus prasinos]
MALKRRDIPGHQCECEALMSRRAWRLLRSLGRKPELKWRKVPCEQQLDMGKSILRDEVILYEGLN